MFCSKNRPLHPQRCADLSHHVLPRYLLLTEWFLHSFACLVGSAEIQTLDLVHRDFSVTFNYIHPLEVKLIHFYPLLQKRCGKTIEETQLQVVCVCLHGVSSAVSIASFSGSVMLHLSEQSRCAREKWSLSLPENHADNKP